MSTKAPPRFSRRSLIALTISLAVFAATFVLMSTGLTDQLDQDGVHYARNAAGELPQTKLPHFVRDVTTLGGWVFLIWSTVTTASVLSLLGRKRSCWHIVFAVVSAISLTMTLKWGIGRPRPAYATAMGLAAKSFPSGHAMVSAVFYPTIGFMLCQHAPRRGLRILLVVNAVGLPLLIGLSRVYLGAHYPTDVVAGWALGVAWTTLCWCLFRASNLAALSSNDEPSAPSRQS